MPVPRARIKMPTGLPSGGQEMIDKERANSLRWAQALAADGPHNRAIRLGLGAYQAALVLWASTLVGYLALVTVAFQTPGWGGLAVLHYGGRATAVIYLLGILLALAGLLGCRTIRQSTGARRAANIALVLHCVCLLCLLLGWLAKSLAGLLALFGALALLIGLFTVSRFAVAVAAWTDDLFASEKARVAGWGVIGWGGTTIVLSLIKKLHRVMLSPVVGTLWCAAAAVAAGLLFRALSAAKRALNDSPEMNR